MTDDEKKDMLAKILNQLNDADPSICAPEPLSAGIIEGPACIRFLILSSQGVVNENFVRNQLPLLKTALNLSARHQLNVANDRGIWLEVPKEDSQRTFVYFSKLREIFDLEEVNHAVDFFIPIAIDLNGKVVSVKFSDDSAPHLLIGGATGSGNR